MRRFFDEDPRERSRARRDSDGDTELTLGSGMLLTVFFGLVLLCGLCFGLGYAVGSRGSKGPAFQSQPPAAGPSPQFPAVSQQGKPSAAEQPPTIPAQPNTADQQTAGAQSAVPGQPAGPVQTAGAVPATAAATAVSAPAAGQQVVTPNSSGWHPVQPALPGGTPGAQTAQPVSANQVRPAIPGQGTLMVQIAALSDQEDAGVLIGALRRRGYTVSAVRYPSDNLIHVCIGPFSNRTDANSMRQKLLSDGYNAQIVQ
ncbi:MAG TPA: SPOR domain-containing protein [Terracidiphilus sp.]|nr:SPOR domain-containing protein [Terracidiphilus sp.]